MVTIAIALIGLLALPGYKTSYDARPYMPASGGCCGHGGDGGIGGNGGSFNGGPWMC